MKTLFFKLTTLVAMGMGVFVPRALADCATTWEVPKNHFDGVDNFGYVEYWDKIAEIDIGEDKPFPIVIGFNSDRDSTSPYLGYGWVMPLLESYMVQTGENTFEIMKPTGYTSGFGRDPKRATAIGGVKGWKGEIGPDTIKVWAPCGWSLTYTRGKLTEIATPKGKRISVNRGLDGQVKDVVMDGRILVKVLKSFEDRVEGIEVQGERIAIEFGEKPRVRSVQGNNVVAGVDRSVGKIILPDGQLKTYDYSVDGTLQPTLRIAGTQMAERKMTWDAARRLITADGEWKYDIKPAETAGQNAAIGRTDRKGAKEFWHYDATKGEEIVQGIDGLKKVTTWFTSGKLAGKIRKKMVSYGSKQYEIHVIYDELGRILRTTNSLVSKIKENNNLTISKQGFPDLIFSFAPNGSISSMTLSDNKQN